MDILDSLRNIIGPDHVLTGSDTAGFATDWIGKYENTPLAVLRPASVDEVSRIMALANDTGTPVVPVSGHTGLAGGAHAPEGSVMLSLTRLNKIRQIKPDARLAIVDGGVVLESLHHAVAEHGLRFPMTFGAQGSCMIAGMLATNAGGSNVLKFGNTRALCIGIEAVLPDGRVLDLMSELHKDNSGYDLRNLLIGSEGTLAVITGAVLKLVPAPAARATALLALDTLTDALSVLNRLQKATGGAVEAFEYMPAHYMSAIHTHLEGLNPVFGTEPNMTILAEIASTAPKDALPGPDGSLPLDATFENILAEAIEAGQIQDAVIAQNDTQRSQMWTRREAAAEVCLSRNPLVNNDISLPLDQVEPFLTRMKAELIQLDPGAETLEVAHLGDGNIHYNVYPSTPALCDPVMELVEDVVRNLGGSFSAEHGIGVSKLQSMQRRKDPVALAVMHQIKQALDPKGIMNPGKVLPNCGEVIFRAGQL
ncbi:FAD/FMN-containing dehydrogenase [Aliiroseovarius halocynthiae]|uniref:FAD-binding oxidoreductase n=1 Tax=Aliiroseovarius halocynthiae TaxID=985055 RepID=A0A545SXW7_9RHOB|nr:FAD-binding oxidoreductase [Aliiroseovarius halocynthiae]TQV69805.1 FAD-binding oxidoreductase [Aliiroseovarius halocynthiae]SMR81724.1 FAD/FMN-containing dehydrogenase [Aliiroseovarius halocynthiae]